MENAEPLNRIDQQLAEISALLTALIFISENIEPHQHELLCHTATSLCHIARDKLTAANRDVSLLMRTAA